MAASFRPAARWAFLQGMGWTVANNYEVVKQNFVEIVLAKIAIVCDDRFMSTDLDTKVRTLLERRRGDWQRIAVDADVSYSWISQFVRGLIPNPGFNTLKKLHAQLQRRRKRRSEMKAPPSSHVAAAA